MCQYYEPLKMIKKVTFNETVECCHYYIPKRKNIILRFITQCWQKLNCKKTKNNSDRPLEETLITFQSLKNED